MAGNVNGISVTVLIIGVDLNQTAGAAGKNQGLVQPSERRPVALKKF